MDILDTILNIKFEAESGMKIGSNPYVSLRIIAELAKNAKDKIVNDGKNKILDNELQSNI